MALRELPLRVGSALSQAARPTLSAPVAPSLRRNASAGAASLEVETSSFFEGSTAKAPAADGFNPVERSRARRTKKRPLPPSRYQYRPPKYYRGPLHPHQPPPVSDPSSRLFEPGPFSVPRLQQTYQSTIAPDLLALTYQHYPFGYQKQQPEQRLREWTGASPYYKNRPLRPPRGRGDELRLLTAPRTFRNIPEVTKVVVHSMVPDAQESSAYLHVGGMVLQAITNIRAKAHKSKTNVVAWNLRKDKHISLTATLEREDAQHFLSKLIDVVLPQIKEWKGVPASSGDGSGNITFGLTPDQIQLFPEVEINYDMYPPKMIPGAHITIQTTATNDRDAHLLTQAIGIPYNGKFKY